MDINLDQKALLDAVDGDIESSFLGGVTANSGPYLPKLPDYDKIPASLRPTGRKGILSTFAGLVKQLGLIRPTKNPLNYGVGFSDMEFGNIQIGFDGRVSCFGRASTNISLSVPVIFTLPVGQRPSQSLYFPVVTSGGATYVIVSTSGSVSLPTSLASGGWVSLSGISFYPG